jgi:hypothetical protein
VHDEFAESRNNWAALASPASSFQEVRSRTLSGDFVPQAAPHEKYGMSTKSFGTRRARFTSRTPSASAKSRKNGHRLRMGAERPEDPGIDPE